MMEKSMLSIDRVVLCPLTGKDIALREVLASCGACLREVCDVRKETFTCEYLAVVAIVAYCVQCPGRKNGCPVLDR